MRITSASFAVEVSSEDQDLRLVVERCLDLAERHGNSTGDVSVYLKVDGLATVCIRPGMFLETAWNLVRRLFPDGIPDADLPLFRIARERLGDL
jgi:hypothetical protein